MKRKVLITVVSFIVAFISKSNINWMELDKNCWDKVLLKEITYDLAMGVFSAMILIWCVDVISEYLEKRIAQKKELETICRIDKVLQHYISRYQRLFHHVVTPICDRKVDSYDIPSHFSMQQMRDLYKSTYRAEYGVGDSAILLFLQSEQELKEQISLLLLNCEFIYHDQLQNVFVDFIDESLKFDGRSAILDASKYTMGEGKQAKKLSQFVYELLSDGSADKYREELEQDPTAQSHVIYPYIMLHNMMENELAIIQRYQKVVGEILQNNVEKAVDN